jgi:hypothetical protein
VAYVTITMNPKFLDSIGKEQTMVVTGDWGGFFMIIDEDVNRTYSNISYGRYDGVNSDSGYNGEFINAFDQATWDIAGVGYNELSLVFDISTNEWQLYPVDQSYSFYEVDSDKNTKYDYELASLDAITKIGGWDSLTGDGHDIFISFIPLYDRNPNPINEAYACVMYNRDKYVDGYQGDKLTDKKK